MHDTQQGTTGSIGPFETGATPGPEASHGFDDPSRVSPEVVVNLIGLLDEFERLCGDPPSAWAAIGAEIESRKARWESRRSGDRPGLAEGSSGTSGSSPPGQSHREPRPFLGFDREMATYERLKPALVEKDAGKWIVIVGDELIGPFDEIAHAERAGLKRFGDGPMLIKQVLAEEPPPLVLPPYLVASCQT